MPKMTGKIKLKKPTRHTALSLVALVLWCAFIFYMSARVAQDSDALSLGFAGRFLHLVVPGFSDMSTADQLALTKSINHPVRKLAHFTEYLVLGTLAINALRLHVGWSAGLSEDRATRQPAALPTFGTTEAPSCSLAVAALSWAFCIFYAVSDEFHQLFVPGRACLFTDVCIDSAGALLGILLLFGALHLISRQATRKRNATNA